MTFSSPPLTHKKHKTLNVSHPSAAQVFCSNSTVSPHMSLALECDLPKLEAATGGSWTRNGLPDTTKSPAGKTGRWQGLSNSCASDSQDTGRAQRFMRDRGAAISAAHIRENTSVYIAQSSRSAAGAKGALESKVYKLEGCPVVLRCDTVWLGEWFLNSLTASRWRHYDSSKSREPLAQQHSHTTSATLWWEPKISHRQICRIIVVPVQSLTYLIPKDKTTKAKIKKKKRQSNLRNTVFAACFTHTHTHTKAKEVLGQ